MNKLSNPTTWLVTCQQKYWEKLIWIIARFIILLRTKGDEKKIQKCRLRAVPLRSVTSKFGRTGDSELTERGTGLALSSSPAEIRRDWPKRDRSQSNKNANERAKQGHNNLKVKETKEQLNSLQTWIFLYISCSWKKVQFNSLWFLYIGECLQTLNVG